MIVSTGIPALDAMFGRGGLYRGSSALLSGGSGTGKTTIAAFMAQAACLQGERALVYLLEESPGQITRDALSVGLDLQRHVDAGLLSFEAARPSLFGLEMHLARMYRDLGRVTPSLVVIDPVSAYRGPAAEVQSVMLRMVDVLKARGITAVFTSLRSDELSADTTNVGLSSLMDTWVKLAIIEANGEMNRTLDVVKARGMSHSNQLREFRMGPGGISLVEPYVGPEGVLTGTARLTQTAREQAEALQRRNEMERQGRTVARRREALERQIDELRADLERDEQEGKRLLEEEHARETRLQHDRAELAAWRGAAE